MRAVSLIVRSKNDHTDFFSRFHSVWRGSRDSNHSRSLFSLHPFFPSDFIHNTILLEWRLETDRMVFRFLTASSGWSTRSNYEPSVQEPGYFAYSINNRIVSRRIVEFSATGEAVHPLRDSHRTLRATTISLHRFPDSKYAFSIAMKAKLICLFWLDLKRKKKKKFVVGKFSLWPRLHRRKMVPCCLGDVVFHWNSSFLVKYLLSSAGTRITLTRFVATPWFDVKNTTVLSRVDQESDIFHAILDVFKLPPFA